MKWACMQFSLSKSCVESNWCSKCDWVMHLHNSFLEPVTPTGSESVISSAKSVSTSSLVPSISSSYSSNIPKPTPTSKPPSTKHPEPKKPERRFDAASFIGGILLCAGVIFLVYIAVRCYKTKPNYSRL